MDPGNLVPIRNQSWQKEFSKVYRTCRDFHKYDVNKSQKEKILPDELLSSANDPGSQHVNFVLQEFLLRTNIFKSKSSLRLIHPFTMQRKHRDSD